MTEWIGYHFLPDDGCIANMTPKVRVEVGQTLTVEKQPVLCRYGFRASQRLLDALGYAPGSIVEKVRLSGIIISDTDKAVATERTCLAIADVRDLLHEFACWCSEQVLLAERAAGREPDSRSWAALDTKRAWLRGEATDEQLSTAESAAWSAIDTELTQRIEARLAET